MRTASRFSRSTGPTRPTADAAARRTFLDAEGAAVTVLSGRATAVAKAGTGAVEMVKLAKASAMKSRTQAINQLKALVVTADPALRESPGGLSTVRLVRVCAQLTGDHKNVTGAAAHTLRLLAHRVTHLTEGIDDLDTRLAETLDAHAPALLERRGRRTRHRRRAADDHG